MFNPVSIDCYEWVHICALLNIYIHFSNVHLFHSEVDFHQNLSDNNVTTFLCYTVDCTAQAFVLDVISVALAFAKYNLFLILLCFIVILLFLECNHPIQIKYWYVKLLICTKFQYFLISLKISLYLSLFCFCFFSLEQSNPVL